MEHASTAEADLEEGGDLLAPDALAFQTHAEITMRHGLALGLGDTGEDFVFGACLGSCEILCASSHHDPTCKLTHLIYDPAEVDDELAYLLRAMG